MKKIIPFDKDTIDTVVFDVDGTLYDKNIEYNYGHGSIQTAHDFFRFFAWMKINGGEKPREVSKSLVEQYQQIINCPEKNKSLQKSIDEIPEEIKNEYLMKVDEYGSNGKVFANEFRQDSKYLHREMLQHIDYSSVLADDPKLGILLESLKSRRYKLGILTTETEKTVKDVALVMGIDMSLISMDTGDEYNFLCSENVKEKKPSPEGYLKLIKIYNKTGREKDIVYVGDHLKKDIIAPMKLGLQAIHVLNIDQKPSLETVKIDGNLLQYVQIGRVYDLMDILL